MKIPVYIFDIDGTLADDAHREHHIHVPEGQKKNWDAYFDMCRGDAPIPHMVHLCKILSAHGRVLFVSGRRAECFDDTIAWLREHVGENIWVTDLHLRSKGDYRNDDIIKIEILEKLVAAGFKPDIVFDDRTRVVNAWRAAGVPCLQVAPGDF